MTLLARLLVAALLLAPLGAAAQTAAMEHWVTAWTGAAQGPYPSGFPSAQPVLALAFPAADGGAHDQSFRLILRPDTWGEAARLRFSNAYGAQPLTLDAMHVAMQISGAALMPATSRAVTFDGRPDVTIPPGQVAWSDPVGLDFVPSALVESGRMAVSFHVVGDAPTMTWHAKALTTSYLSRPGAGAAPAGDDSELGFPFTTTSWYFLDAVDMMAAPQTRAIVAFGDSITDGAYASAAGTTWPAVLARLAQRHGKGAAVVNAGISADELTTDQLGAPGAGMAGLKRYLRDVVDRPGVTDVVVLFGANDINRGIDPAGYPNGASAGDLIASMRMQADVAHQHHLRIYAGTVTPFAGFPGWDTPQREAVRLRFNRWIRHTGAFDGVIDFADALKGAYTPPPLIARLSPQPAGMAAICAGDAGLHPNDRGYAVMGTLAYDVLFHAKLRPSQACR